MAVTDPAVALSAAADAASLAANTTNTSQLHYAAYYAHQSALAGWTAVGNLSAANAASAKAQMHQTQANNHLTTANSLKAAGK